jgi:HAD superfamily hydrolase (TIGR01509 family)
MIRAVVFDFDGLIFDSEGPLFTAWQEAFAAYGCSPLTIEEWSAEIGTVGVLDIVGLFRRRATRPVDINEMQQRRRARVAELLALETVQPGVHAWLDEADALGYPCAVASSSEMSWVEPRLAQLGLRSRFVHLACRSKTIAAKPAPDSYLAACAALGVEPEEALAIEDSPHGVTAAKCAGLACVAVPHAITEQLDLSHADLRVDSLADVTLTQVLANLRQARG